MKAPWAGEKVSTFIRVLAWFFVLCASFAGAVFIYFTYTEGLPKFDDFGSFFRSIPAIYLFFVFLKVALSGKAPLGWVPWK